MKSKLLVIANYFYPEVASTGQILTELCENITDKYDVTVICAVPCYTGKIEEKYKKKKLYFEKYKDISVIRVRVSEFDKKNKLSRVKHILSYFFNSIRAIKKSGKQDVVFTISQPPILGGMLGVIAKKNKKAKLIYNIQDFNPEQVLAVKYSKIKLITNLMMFFDKRTCKKSDLIITVGNDMKETLNKRFNNKNVPTNIVINNWIDEKEIYPLEKNNKKIIEFKEKYNMNDKFIIMYSGNVGLYYDLENIIKIMGNLAKKDVIFAFIGEGAVKNELQKYVNDNNLNEYFRFIPYQDKKDLIYSLNSADVHLVTNSKGIKGVSVPSKIYGVMATNVPILGILEKDSEAWNLIEKSDCGCLAETGDYLQIEQKLSDIIKNKEKFTKKHLTGRKYLEEYLTKDKSIEKYKNAIKKIIK